MYSCRLKKILFCVTSSKMRPPYFCSEILVLCFSDCKQPPSPYSCKLKLLIKIRIVKSYFGMHWKLDSRYEDECEKTKREEENVRFSSVPTRKCLCRWTSKDLSESYLCSGILLGMTKFSSVSIMRRVRKKIMRGEKRRERLLSLINLYKQEEMFYNQLSVRITEWSGNIFIREGW